MLDKVKKYVDKWHMLQKEDCVIAGVSGGADSVCLLFVLLELQKELGFQLVAAHVNHGLRGEAADADEAYVKELCKEHGISCETYFANVELIAKNRKQSTEEAGREVRKEFFRQVLEKYHGTKIALAHHQNDSAETFLLNLARGTGLKGLGGIAPVNGNVIRPLLCVERNEIEVYLQERGIRYCVDETNAGDAYTRNRIRNHVLPYLEREVNGKTVEHMNETMEQLRQVQEFLEEQTAEYLILCAGETEKGYFVDKEKYRTVPKVIQPLLLKQILVNLCNKEKDLEAVHLKQLQELFEKQTGRKLDLPYQMEAKRVYQGIEISLKGQSSEKREDEKVFPFQAKEAEFAWKNKTISCRIVENLSLKRQIGESNTQNLKTNADTVQKTVTSHFNCDIIKGNISFRTRRQGDYITIHPDGRTQKLKTYFINEKIPQEERDKILLVAEGSHILWIVGYRRGLAYPVNENTKRILEIRIDEGENYGRKN